MKKFILGTAAATLIASPILVAAPASAAQWNGRTAMQHNRGDRHDNGRYYGRQTTYRTSYRAPTRVTYQQTYRPSYRSWNRGDRFDSRYAGNYRVVGNYRDYGLQAPPTGYRWEQSGNDAVLVALAGGLIGAVIGGALN